MRRYKMVPSDPKAKMKQGETIFYLKASTFQPAGKEEMY